MDPLTLVGLRGVMERTEGRADLIVALIDGPVLLEHPALDRRNIRQLNSQKVDCSSSSSFACSHGTLIAGILSARRGTDAPGICPGCSLLIRPIFSADSDRSGLPIADPMEVAKAIVECVDNGATVLNLSIAISGYSIKGEKEIDDALSYAVRHRVITVASAGNQSAIRCSVITRHQGTIPVMACDATGNPTEESNLATTIGRNGLRAPGTNVRSLDTDGMTSEISGTSAAAPFVTGAIALLWSIFPSAAPAALRFGITRAGRTRRRSIIAPMLDARLAFDFLRNEVM
jgi:subtilisin family serine protease